MQKKKNIKLLVLFIALVIVNMAVIFLDGDYSEQNADRYKFTLIDTSQVNKITLKQSQETISFEKSANTWQVNGKYPMDERMIGLIFAVMTSVETSRPVGSEANNDIADKLLSEGVLVEFYSGDEVISGFYTGGNPTKTSSYMMKVSESIPHVVYIPGYSSYIAGLFELKLSDWRSKKAFETSWSSLKSLTLKSVKDDRVQLSITYQDNFFKVAGISNVDTAKMMNYLETTTGLLIDQYIYPGEFPLYDSLATTQPAFTVLVGDSEVAKNARLQLFAPAGNKSHRLGKLLPSEQMVLIRNKKVEAILALNSDFERSN